MRNTLFQIVENLKELQTSDERSKPPKGYPKDKDQYAIPDEYLFPIENAKHVRAAVVLFGKHNFKDEAQKKEAAKRILRAAKRHGVDVGKETEVYHAAHGD